MHRLVRISPFNAQGKRQTSFVSLDVMPDIEEDLDVEINEDDESDCPSRSPLPPRGYPKAFLHLPPV